MSLSNSHPVTAAIATVALLGLSDPLGADSVTMALRERADVWPLPEQAYDSPTLTVSTFSFREVTPTHASHDLYDFEREITSIFATLAEGQEPLEAEFKAIWDAHEDDLYQS